MLFRKPVKGDSVRNLQSGSVSPVNRDWTNEDFKHYEKLYEFVTVIPVEPPPKPNPRYVNVYIHKGDAVIDAARLSGATYRSREAADKGAASNRVGCFDLSKFVGVFED